jgi:hypothetical protein
MKQDDQHSHRHVSTGWQILSELTLQDHEHPTEVITLWLNETLRQLDLPEEFTDKVFRSVQDTSARLFQTETVMKFEHIHLIIFIPQGRISASKNWGFFRVEKIENPAGSIGISDHTIEYYLYMERE